MTIYRVCVHCIVIWEIFVLKYSCIIFVQKFFVVYENWICFQLLTMCVENSLYEKFLWPLATMKIFNNENFSNYGTSCATYLVLKRKGKDLVYCWSSCLALHSQTTWPGGDHTLRNARRPSTSDQPIHCQWRPLQGEACSELAVSWWWVMASVSLLFGMP